MAKSNLIKFLITIGATCEFIRQGKNADLSHFELLGPIMNSITSQLASLELNKTVKLLISIKCQQIKAILPPTNEKIDFKLNFDRDIDLSCGDLIHLESNLAMINAPIQIGDDVKEKKLQTTSTSTPLKTQKPEISMEEAFFRSHPSSLRRTVDFVTERIVSNCVKHFRTKVIPDILRSGVGLY